MTPTEQQTAEGILFTDMYQLTMAHLYFRLGLHEKPAQFDHFFRSYPDYGLHKAGYCINAGLAWLLDWMERAHFREDDLAFLQAQTGLTGRRLFADDFLDWLRTNGDFAGIAAWRRGTFGGRAGLVGPLRDRRRFGTTAREGVDHARA